MVKPHKSRKNRTSSRSLKPRGNPGPKRTLGRDSDCLEDVLNDLFDEMIKESKGFDDGLGEYSTVGEMLGLFDDDKDDHIALDINRLLNDNAQSTVTSPDFQIWSPTPDHSGFDDAEYFLNFLTPFEEEEEEDKEEYQDRQPKMSFQN